MVPLVALNEMKMVEELYTSQKTENIILENRIGDRLSATSIFDATPLFLQLKKTYTQERYDKLAASGKKVYLTTTCLQSGELVVFTTDKIAAQSVNYEVETINDVDTFP